MRDFFTPEDNGGTNGGSQLSENSRFITKLADKGYKVPRLGFGTAALSQDGGTFGYAVEKSRAHSTVREILEAGTNFIDTSRNYGDGYSEACIGDVLREMGGAPKDLLLSTKLDRNAETGAFDGAQARRSLETSLVTLGVDHIPVLYLHDPEHARSIAEVEADDGSIRELMKIRDEGLATTIGLGAGDVDVMMPLLRNWDFDVVLTHNRYSLLNRNAAEMVNYGVENGIAMINAGVFAGGIFAKGSKNYSRYVYQEADEKTLSAIQKIEQLCERFNVSAGAVALQFSTRNPLFVSTIIGVSKPERIASTMALDEVEIPDALWEELKDIEFSTENPEKNRVMS